ncbi:MAG: carbohydrate kinase family protein [bacterium]|nr:carbohydrate kinase family protein [bacterium]MDE0601342.1 carbohydrate kinase family protein [bacterium]
MNSQALVVYGDLSADIGLRIDEFPTAGLDTSATHQRVTTGGSAANCAVAAARLGVRVELVARVGDDLFADLLIGDLERNGVGTSAVERTEGPSPLVVTLIDPRGQRSFVSARGPASGSIPPEVFLPRLDDASMVHLSGYSFQDPGSRSVALHLLEEARRWEVPVSLDPSPLFAENYRTESGWMEGIDFLFPNLHEATAITGRSSPEDSARALRGLGAEAVAVTMGADGCVVLDDSGLVRIPAITEFPVVDTTGAGDGFAGGFLAVTLAGGAPAMAARVGTLVAARIISERGGHTGSPSLEELGDLARSLGDEDLQEAAGMLPGTVRSGSPGGIQGS